MLGIGCWHNFKNCSQYPLLASCKNWEFLEQDKTPILIFKVEPILHKLKKKSKTAGAHPSAAGPNNGAAHADCIRTAAPPFCHAHGFSTTTTPHAACAATVHRLARL
jgi:hypothetical protein